MGILEGFLDELERNAELRRRMARILAPELMNAFLAEAAAKRAELEREILRGPKNP
ncbi:MAG: hypothetical protein QW371_03225 [Candidatus Bathyarchaeia archaeon]